MTKTSTQIGDRNTAERIAWHHYNDLPMSDGCELLAIGSNRTVYVDRRTRTVYKVGVDGANRREVRVLAELRAQGADYAPPATLYEVTVPTVVAGLRDEITCTVVAMPYLPDDGSVPRPYPIPPAAADMAPDVMRAHRGQLWLIDAGGL